MTAKRKKTIRNEARLNGNKPRGQNISIADDPIALQVIWRRLIAIADEAATTLRRTSFSPIVRESNDFACVLFDAAGRAIAENTIGIPSFNMTLGRTLDHFLSKRSASEWKPGDVGMCNDPWLTSGHLPDITIIAPIFVNKRLLGWTGSIAHMADIGGALWSADTREVFEEGIRFPFSLLMREGAYNEDVVRLLRANVRIPDLVMGDIAAQIAAGEAAGRALRALAEYEHITDFSEISNAIRSRSENVMRRAIVQIPDGSYKSSVDMDGTDEGPIHIEVEIKKKGSNLFIDYAGTSPQADRAINTVLNYTEAYTCYPLKCLLDPLTPRNDGSYKMIHVSAPLGSILNPRFPAPVHARQLVGHCLPAVLYHALAPVVGDRITADSGSAPTLRLLVNGFRDDQSPYTTIFFINGGMGARSRRDGLSATCFPSNVVCGSMEIIEALAPLRVWQKELAIDSGGPGAYRGGLGQDVEIELIGRERANISMLADRRHHPAAGVLGGSAGAPSRIRLNGQEDAIPTKGKSRIRQGDRLQILYPGGGGYGDPRQRSRAAVRNDLEEGLISEEAAQRIYGL